MSDEAQGQASGVRFYSAPCSSRYSTLPASIIGFGREAPALPALMKLLVVDDDPEIRRLIGLVLAPTAPDIAECADGADALAAYASHAPDVVLMDISMRQVDGLAATAAIMAAHPNARVVIVSNHGAADLREAANRAGACGYVLKEDLLQLRQLIERVSPRHAGS